MDAERSARVAVAAARFESGDIEFAACEFAALGEDPALSATDRTVMYVNLATVASAAGRGDDVLTAFDRAIELEQPSGHFARDSKQRWLEDHPQDVTAQTPGSAGPFRVLVGWAVVWKPTLAWAVFLAVVLNLGAMWSRPVRIGDVITAVAITAAFGVAMGGIRALMRRQWTMFEGWTISYRPALGRRRTFDVSRVRRVRRKNSRAGRYFAVTLAAQHNGRRKVIIAPYVVQDSVACGEWLQRLAAQHEVDLDTATAALLGPWR